MEQELKTLSQKILSLSPSDRASLAHLLIQSLEKPESGDLDQVWAEELLRRDEKLASGETSERPAFEALAEICQSHARETN